MKLKRVSQIFLAITLVLSQVFAFVPAVQAQEGGPDPWANVFDSEGNLLPSVVDMGEIVTSPPPDWWPSNAVTDALGFYPSYHQYVTAAGDVVIVPSASTLFFMALNSGESGLDGAYGSAGSGSGQQIMGAAYLVGLLTGLESGQNLLNGLAGIPEFLDSSGNVDPNKFADALISGDMDIWSLGGDVWNVLGELIKKSQEDAMFATTFLLYVQGNCASSPTGCPANLCQIVPTACPPDPNDPTKPGTPVDPPSCPATTIHIGSPTLKVYPVAPASPLVVGQDPEKRGADVGVEVTIPPTIYEYYVPIPVWEEIEECNLPDGGYTGTLDCKTDNILPANNGYITRDMYLVRFDCEHHVEVYPEPISMVNAQASLTGASREWIIHDLGAYYYGAEVYQSNYSIIPGLGAATVGCDGSGTCAARALVEKIQFRDPGNYVLNLRVQTMGTPVTTGRLLTGAGSMGVSMISARLIEAGN